MRRTRPPSLPLSPQSRRTQHGDGPVDDLVVEEVIIDEAAHEVMELLGGELVVGLVGLGIHQMEEAGLHAGTGDLSDKRNEGKAEEMRRGAWHKGCGGGAGGGLSMR